MNETAQITRRNIDIYCCAVCKANLIQPFDGHGVITCCSKDRSHRGIMKKQDPTVKTLEGLGEAGEQALIAYENNKGEKKNMEEMTGDKQTALARYEGRTDLEKADIKDILLTIWPDAPEPEVKKAMMLCWQYKLNPLAKHVYLIPFDRYEKRGESKVKIGTDWTLVWGIEATRLVARRAARKHKITYGYEDFSPRAMTEEEQTKINGKVDNTKYWAITILRDSQGNKAYGVGSWPRDKMVKGADKGNTPENMARLRSERNGINRLFPGETPNPDEGEVEDEAYMDAPVITEIAGELTEGEVVEENDAIREQVTEELPAPTSPPAKSQQATVDQTEVVSIPPARQGKTTTKGQLPPRDPASIKNLTELDRACFEDFGLQPKEVLAKLNVKAKSEITMTPSDCYKQIRELSQPKLQKEV